MAKYYLGIDLGGTQVKIAIVSEKGKIVEETNVDNRVDSVPERLVRDIADNAKRLKNLKLISGIGVGVAGDIDQEKGIVRFSPNLHKWKKVPLKKMLGKHFSKKIVVDNDANAAALGAFYLDAKGKLENVLCVTLGTGVGGGIIINGKVYRGATGTAGEIGHITLFPDGIKCQCGNRGCIERYVGASGLSARTRELLSGNKSSKIFKAAGGSIKGITPKAIYQAAVLGDSIAKKIWEEAGRNIGIILAGIVNLLNPEMIVLSGGISQAKSFLLKPLIKTIRERSFRSSSQACRVVVSKHTNRLGVVGAALLAH